MDRGKIYTFPTLTGEMSIENTGKILPHEHLVIFPSDFCSENYDEIKQHYIPIYKKLVEEYNCNVIAEMSPRLNADGLSARGLSIKKNEQIELYKEICVKSGMNLVLSTGFYREVKRPAYFFESCISSLADEMICDIEHGIGGTGVKAGIIKVAVDDINSPADLKLIEAAAIAQKATGVSITTHTCTPEIRLNTLNLLERAGVDPQRICLGHADTNASASELLSLAQRGCNFLLTIWGITDGATIGMPGTLPKMHSANLSSALVENGYIDQLLISIDYAAEITDGKLSPALYNIPERSSLYAFTFAVPALKELNITDGQINKITVDNPRKMLAKL